MDINQCISILLFCSIFVSMSRGSLCGRSKNSPRREITKPPPQENQPPGNSIPIPQSSSNRKENAQTDSTTSKNNQPNAPRTEIKPLISRIPASTERKNNNQGSRSSYGTQPVQRSITKIPPRISRKLGQKYRTPGELNPKFELPKRNVRSVNEKHGKGFARIWVEWRENASIAYSGQNIRRYMEDHFVQLPGKKRTEKESQNFDDNPDFYAVIDGHGGDLAANLAEKYFTEYMPILLVDQQVLNYYRETPESRVDFRRFLRDQITLFNERLYEFVINHPHPETGQYDHSGATFLAAIKTGDELIILNLGDSKAVLCDANYKAIPLSDEHKPEVEKMRLKEAGGEIRFDRSDQIWRTKGGLAMSRSIGDFYEPWVIDEPSYFSVDLNRSGAKFMIMASDGFWDAISNDQEAVDLIKRSYKTNFQSCAQFLAEVAIKRGSTDNITVLVIIFLDKNMIVKDSSEVKK